MNEKIFASDFSRAPFGYATHRIILDKHNNPVDYQFIEVNKKFEELTGMSAKKIIGKTVTQVLPGIANDKFDWIRFYGDIAINQTSKEFEQYSVILNKWYRVSAFSPEKEYFVTYFTDITKDKQQLENDALILELSRSMLSINNRTINYKEITENLLKLSGAKYAIFNLYSDDQTKIEHKAVCGLTDQINKVYNKFGYSLQNKQWNITPGKLAEIVSGENLKKVSMDELVDGQIPPVLYKSVNKMLGLGNIYSVQIRHENTVLGDFLLFYDKNKDLENTEEVKTYVNIVGIALDRIKAEAARETELKRNKELRFFYMSVINAIQDGISVVLPDFTIISANDKIRKWNENDEVIGRKCYDVYKNKNKPCKSCVCTEAFRSGKISVNEIRGLYGNIDNLYEISALPLTDPATGKITSVVELVRDITETRSAQKEIKNQKERLQHVIAGTNIGTWEWNVQTGETVFNERWANIIGYTLDELMPVSIKTWNHFVHPDDVEKSEESIQRHFDGKDEFYEQECRMKHKNGNWIWILDKGKVVTRTSEGKPEWMFGTHQDITDRKNSEKELLIAKEKAEESDRLKSAFLANMSHEIRTPMNAIVGFASFLHDKDLNQEEIRKYSEYIISSGDHLLELINDIIDISKIDAGEIRTTIDETNLTELLQEVYGIFEPQMKLKQKEGNIILDAKIPEENFYVLSDIVRLRQILLNLINNALKFTHEGKVEFGFEENGNEIVFYVQDTGIGISEKDQEIIFERFRQASGSTEKIYGGTGLGLSIAKAYVELLGGHMHLTSVPGSGSTFSFSIPNNKVEKEAEVTSKKETALPLAFNGEHILIAEDDFISFSYLSEILSNYNLKVSRAESGEEAIKLILNDPTINLVLMDILMPVMDGLTATRLIREKQINIPVIAQTAYAFESDRERSIGAGCNEYLSKPIKEPVLIDVLHKFLKK
ncbi:ATP-binding protein [Saccharicrinis sp. FJH2]|uniref:ATP-binding protein n=1 Tax=Saccharicrinis sp. FJH65 TaxID=3344659 RepID=UPI0035F4F626